ncbi:hypothetical protein TCAP_01811 [Tolypocladium capitatum]|uniref:Uncharacterized protein n=1 Tax=Tolypocladium capitatum TaxID=45235 RepID=A0A2K3QL54_9HYPO|nr:hypothetical protein TCAP_01811 [Tolypocladium capitatum]
MPSGNINFLQSVTAAASSKCPLWWKKSVCAKQPRNLSEGARKLGRREEARKKREMEEAVKGAAEEYQRRWRGGGAAS